MSALIVALVILIVFSGFFSATETAYTSFSSVRMRRFAAKKKSAQIALKLSENYNKILTTLLIGNNIVNTTASTIGTVLFVALLGEGLGPTISTIVLTVVVLIFGEITPKTIAKEYPEAFACFAAYPVYVFIIILYPLNWLFGRWETFVFFVFRLNHKKQSSKCLFPMSKRTAYLMEQSRNLFTALCALTSCASETVWFPSSA